MCCHIRSKSFQDSAYRSTCRGCVFSCFPLFSQSDVIRHVSYTRQMHCKKVCQELPECKVRRVDTALSVVPDRWWWGTQIGCRRASCFTSQKFVAFIFPRVSVSWPFVKFRFRMHFVLFPIIAWSGLSFEAWGVLQENIVQAIHIEVRCAHDSKTVVHQFHCCMGSSLRASNKQSCAMSKLRELNVDDQGCWKLEWQARRVCNWNWFWDSLQPFSKVWEVDSLPASYVAFLDHVGTHNSSKLI